MAQFPATASITLALFLATTSTSLVSAAPIGGIRVKPVCAENEQKVHWQLINESMSGRSIYYKRSDSRTSPREVRLQANKVLVVSLAPKRNEKNAVLRLSVKVGTSWHHGLFRGRSLEKCGAFRPVTLPTTIATPTKSPMPLSTSSPTPLPTTTASATPSRTQVPSSMPTVTATPTANGPVVSRTAPLVVSVATLDRAIFDSAVENGKTVLRLKTNVSFTRSGFVVIEPNLVIDLNGFTLSFNSANAPGASGVYAYRYASPEKWGIDVKSFPEVTSIARANGMNLTVRNGEIRWLGSSATNSPGSYPTGILATAEAGTITVENVRISAGGTDGWCVYANYTGLTIRDSWCENSSLATENRHQLPGSVRAGNKVIAERNVIIGGNSGFIVGPDSIVRENIIRQSGFATNGYGVHTYRIGGTTISRNLILPTNGRGIMYNGGLDSNGNVLSINNQAFDNFVVARESPNAEFGDNLNAPCFRMRYDATANTIHDNICFAFGGGTYAGATGIYLSNTPSTAPLASRINFFYDNLLVAFLVGDPQSASVPFRRYANGITFELQGQPGNLAKDRLANNVIVTNSYGIRVSGADGPGFQHFVENTTIRQGDGELVKQLLDTGFNDPRFAFSYPVTNRYVTAGSTSSLRRESLEELKSLVSGKSSNWASRPFTPLHTAYYQGSELWLLGTNFPHGGDLRAQDIFIENPVQGPTRIVSAHQLFAIVRRSGTPLQNTTFQILNNGVIVSEVTSDSTGKATLPVLDFEFQRAATEPAFRRITSPASSLRVMGGTIQLSLPSVRNSVTNPVTLDFP